MNLITNPFENPLNIADGTPANAVVRFLFGWKNRNPELTLEGCNKTWISKGKAKEKLALWLGDIFLVGAKIVKIKMLNVTTYDVTVRIGLRRRGYKKIVAGIMTARVMCEDAPYSRSVNGKWGLYPPSILKAIGVYRRIFVDQNNEINVQ